jgi:hypothetical protein
MAQPKGQTGEPLSYQFQFVVCAHHGHSVDARLDCAAFFMATSNTWVRLSVIIAAPLRLRF